jgi:hypothetical protein
MEIGGNWGESVGPGCPRLNTFSEFRGPGGASSHYIEWLTRLSTGF